MSQNHPDELRQQVEFTKEFLEWVHGMALQYENIDQARAYYEAIDLVEASLECEWAPDRMGWEEWQVEDIERSREAREEGVGAATLHDLEMERIQNKYGRQSIFSELWDNLTPVIIYRGIVSRLSRKTNKEEAE